MPLAQDLQSGQPDAATPSGPVQSTGVGGAWPAGYELLSQLGGSASSRVFAARRIIAGVMQPVALKLIDGSIASREARLRFDGERIALATLSHPGIARLLDGGVTPRGEAYLAVEWIDGVDIRRHVRERRLALPGRAVLFLAACRAVEAAHHALIVHGNIKPSNLLVDRDGCVKLVDFGTRHAHVPREDAASRSCPPDAAEDIRALGAVLRILVADDAAPGQRPRGLPAQELALIVAKATAHASTDRYPTVRALRDDVERWVDGRPVHAKRATPGYRLHKLVRRHPRASLLLGGFLVALGCAVGATFRHAAVAGHEAMLATRASDKARAMLLALEDNFFPRDGRGSDGLTVLDAAADGLDALLVDRTMDPTIRIELIERLTRLLGRHGNVPRARQLLSAALASSPGLPDADDPLRLSIESQLAWYDRLHGDFEAARTRLDEVAGRIPSGLHALRSEVLRRSASVALLQGDRTRALHDAAEAVDVARQAGDGALLLEALGNRGAILTTAGENDAALAAMQDVLEHARRMHGQRHEKVALALAALARLERRRGHAERSLALVTEAIDIDRAIYRQDHWIVANHLNALASTQLLLRDLDGALASARESQRINAQSLGDTSLDAINGTLLVAGILLQMERYHDVVALLSPAAFAPPEGDAAVRRDARLGHALVMSGDAGGGIARLDELSQPANVATMRLETRAVVAELGLRVALLLHDERRIARWTELLAGTLPALAQPDNDTVWHGRVETLLGMGALALRQNDAAIDRLESARTAIVASAYPDQALRVENLQFLARAYARSGRMADARTTSADAARLLARLPHAPARLREDIPLHGDR